MIKIKDFNFKNVNNIEFIHLDKCPCGCNEEPMIIIEDKDLNDTVVSILSEIDCTHKAGVVIKGNNETYHYLFTEDGNVKFLKAIRN